MSLAYYSGFLLSVDRFETARVLPRRTKTKIVILSAARTSGASEGKRRICFCAKEEGKQVLRARFLALTRSVAFPQDDNYFGLAAARLKARPFKKRTTAVVEPLYRLCPLEWPLLEGCPLGAEWPPLGRPPLGRVPPYDRGVTMGLLIFSVGRE